VGEVSEAVDLARDAIRRGVALGDALMPSPKLYLGLAQVFADDLAGAEAALGEGRRQVEAVADPWLASRYQATESVAALLSGRWTAAVDIAESLLRLADERGIHSAFPQVTAIAGLCELHRGDLARARAWLSRAQEQAAGPAAEPIGFLFLWWLDALLAGEDGDPARGVAVLGAGYDVLGAVTPIARLYFGPDLVRLAMAAGDPARAAAVADDLEALADLVGTATARAQAGAARGVADSDAARLLIAAADAERSPCRFLAARVAHDAGAALQRAGRYADAARCLHTAGVEYRHLGATLHAACLPAEERLAPSRAGLPHADLTPAESRVLGLVREGLDNQVIADRLRVSKRTVESHLSKLYLKLEVRGRVALATIDVGAAPR
jgi:DNA-binding NarL/FixJ family response regulator